MTGIVVFVDSRGGNTRKIAEVIAAEAGTAVGDITDSLPDTAKLVFLGSGTYGGAPGIGMMKFVTDNDFSGRNVAVFGTSMSPGGAQKMVAAMVDALKRKGATVLGTFDCRGKFLLFRRGHPDETDLGNARAFARDMISKH
ncbi:MULTISPECIES: flavodoxin family protein [unclassified Methanoregula]|uniref:flavodoxin family protein n=1 Tax=unclassified Methanoregula TaxID=2649730 RepID=UPI0009C73023|nr:MULTISPECIES: flavodoxin family protein [unclassified Methanoregula]OPX63720.1 MAG: flavodoxin [Methanoregula sp. PtaB.Bin085]OPY37263.1 MAG: flavodoxin [Methanoregula sp. PtaU1.Bin006]